MTLSFHRFDTWRARIWAFGQMTFARWPLWRLSECRFWKLCGSGSGDGFAAVPEPSIWAILACWPDETTARRQLAEAGVFRRWRARAAESWTLYLRPVSARGAWSGRQPFDAGPETEGPLAALTRATIRTRHLAPFWKRVPRISDAVAKDGNVAFKIGISALPWLHQATFSVWPDADTMAEFARRDGPHARAIRAVRDGGWFSEELYARFRVIGTEGTWSGARAIPGMAA
ncbi:spheroidene monooxygenase [Palleronia sp. LCG004]|uniref:spheroidene monooxygenase n=1 Tax=Palleronia sp. LCG004 TaxID=3079304 RepID=UPI002942AAC1|nr:spheroidene monooxygenase [Palleronia sp. LCG004]WOI56335.1 spheroidene monooxygenase [Palleronia sp. LCG004]